jgi:FkbM family methyltransferase
MTAGSRLSRWAYYISSIPTILLGMKGRARILALFLGLPVRRPFVVELRDGTRFRVRTRMDVWFLKETCLDLDYERDFVSLSDGWTIFDVGAGFGDFAVRVARQGPRSRVYAFEPLPEALAQLEENIRLNGVTNLQTFPDAIAGSDRRLPLYTLTELSGQHRTYERRRLPRGPVATVPAMSLAQAFARLGVDRCDFLKMDCEGLEYDILFSADEKTLRKIRHVAMEYHDAVTIHVHEELVRFLAERGFLVRTRPNPAQPQIGFLFASNRSLSESAPSLEARPSEARPKG